MITAWKNLYHREHQLTSQTDIELFFNFVELEDMLAELSREKDENIKPDSDLDIDVKDEIKIK